MQINIVDYDPIIVHQMEFGSNPVPVCNSNDTTMHNIPYGFNVVGTCGSCGGPLLSPMLIVIDYDYVPDIFCHYCGKKAKKIVQPNYGPIREME